MSKRLKAAIVIGLATLAGAVLGVQPAVVKPILEPVIEVIADQFLEEVPLSE